MIGMAVNSEHEPDVAVTEQEQLSAVSQEQARPSMRVVSAIAEATDADPTTMEPLYTAVDPDALDSLLESDAEVRFRFEYEGHDVEITSGGRVSVDGVHYSGEVFQ